MTISSTSTRKEYTGDGATVAFATSPVVFFDEGDLTVYKVTTATGAATLQVLTTDYTVSGGSGSTGTVTMVVAPTAAQTLVIVRELDLVQEVDFVNNEATDAEVSEDALDKLTLMTQQLDAKIDRSARLADSDVTGASVELPTPSASKLLGWDSAGTGLENYASASIAATIVPTAFMETLLDDTSAATARATLGAVSVELIDAAGDLLVGTAADTAARKAVGAAGTVLMSRAADTDKLAYVAALRSQLAGLGMANGTDATNDINIAAGGAMDSTNAYWITLAAITKQLDAAWAVGTDAGGLDTGAIANDTYHVWVIARSDTGVTDALFSLSATAPTMPTNYDFKRRIGSIVRTGGAIKAFIQNGDSFRWVTPVADINATASGTSAVTRTLTVPTGVVVFPDALARVTTGATASGGVLITSLDETDSTPSNTLSTSFITAATSVGPWCPILNLHTNTSAQVRSRENQTDSGVAITTYGWIDTRGRDA